MIITNIIGGLGNQMFQYAAARSISIDLKQILYLDISGFKNYELHQGFELQRLFNCVTKIANEEDLSLVLGWQSPLLVRRILKKRPFNVIHNKNLVIEPSFAYWDGINQISANSYLEGYWQSEKYFANHADVIRSDFTFKLPISQENTGIVKMISQVNAISLHVRRGDYVSNQKTNAAHGVCSLDYYRAAIQLITKKVEHPVFFIFSDDIKWVKSNLTIDSQCVYVEHNQGQESYNDMWLMSLCKHNIIANSSFSWWGAWLNANVEKIVVAPKQWFASQKDVRDLLPNGWVRL